MIRYFRLSSILIVVLIALLVVSLAANQILFSFAAQYATEVNSVRLDPLDLGRDFATPAPPMPGQERVVFFGDSRIEQWPMPPDDSAFQYVNRGISGETTAQAVGRFEAQIAPFQPSIVVLQIGVNDLKAIPMFPRQEASILANCLTNIRQIIAWSEAMNATIILTPVFPVSEPTLERRLFYWSDDVAASIHSVNDHLRVLASDRVILFDTDTLLVGANGLTRPEYAADTLHLNAQGYAVLNQGLEQRLKEVVLQEK